MLVHDICCICNIPDRETTPKEGLQLCSFVTGDPCEHTLPPWQMTQRGLLGAGPRLKSPQALFG